MDRRASLAARRQRRAPPAWLAPVEFPRTRRRGGCVRSAQPPAGKARGDSRAASLRSVERSRTRRPEVSGGAASRMGSRMKAVFDTNILIDYLGGYAPAQQTLQSYADKVISRITWIEVLVGARNAADEASVRAFLSSFRVA